MENLSTYIQKMNENANKACNKFRDGEYLGMINEIMKIGINWEKAINVCKGIKDLMMSKECVDTLLGETGKIMEELDNCIETSRAEREAYIRRRSEEIY